MINIKVIEIKKCFKWISVFTTLLLCVFSFKLLILESNEMVVKASGIEKGQMVVQADEEAYGYDNVLILILNKTIPLLEVHYKEDHKTYGFKDVMKLALGKVIRFDYEDPKTMLKAQISLLNEVNDDLAEQESEYSEIDIKTQQETDHPSYIEDISATAPKDTRQTKEDPTKGEIPAINYSNEEKNQEELPEVAIPVVTSPIRMPSKVKLDSKNPSIFVYHTHGTESYLPESVGNFHSLNEKYTVRQVGKVLTDDLVNRGYRVIHEEMLHDYPSYVQSYIRALETLKTNLQKTPSLKIIFDIHRDAAPDSPDARENSYVMINNEKVAKFAIVVGTQNENAEALKLFAEYVKAKSDELYPGFAKKTILKEFKFNQYNSDHYALIEVGNTANDINEALRTAKYLGKVLDEVIKDIKTDD